MVDKKSMYHVPHADKKVSGWDKLSGLHLKLFPNEWGSLILAKAYINNKDWYSYQFLSFKTLDCLNSASVWLLYVALFIIRISRYWSTSALCMTDWLAFPHAKYHMWGLVEWVQNTMSLGFQLVKCVSLVWWRTKHEIVAEIFAENQFVVI
jgi:hypothetical protein